MQDKLIRDIFQVTMLLQETAPALYAHLDETPLFLLNQPEGISAYDLEQYLESLTLQLPACTT